MYNTGDSSINLNANDAVRAETVRLKQLALARRYEVRLDLGPSVRITSMPVGVDPVPDWEVVVRAVADGKPEMVWLVTRDSKSYASTDRGFKTGWYLETSSGQVRALEVGERGLP